MTSACQVCTKPSDLFLCQVHVDELVEALLALATGGIARVTVVSRARWRIPELPWVSVTEYRPGLLAELETTTTRQHKLGAPGGKRAGSEPPMLYHVAASELADVARSIVSGWARDHADRHPHLELPATHAAAAEWMAAFPNLIAEHPAAGEMHGDVVGLVRRIRAMIDRPRDRRYLGQCSARLRQITRREWELCERDVYAEPGKVVVQCRCGAVHDVASRLDRLRSAVDDQLATAAEASRALAATDTPCTPAMIRRYAHREKLTAHPPHALDPRAYPRYRIGDIRKLLAEVASEGGGSAA